MVGLLSERFSDSPQHNLVFMTAKANRTVKYQDLPTLTKVLLCLNSTFNAPLHTQPFEAVKTGNLWLNCKQHCNCFFYAFFFLVTHITKFSPKPRRKSSIWILLKRHLCFFSTTAFCYFFQRDWNSNIFFLQVLSISLSSNKNQVCRTWWSWAHQIHVWK